MNTTPISDTWERGSPYEQYIGRWSRRIAPRFLSWLNVPAGKRWLDVGCGTGALSAAVLEQASPGSLVGVEPSEGFLGEAVRRLGARARFVTGTASAIPLPDAGCDVVVSALVLNFVPDLPAALAEMQRVAAPGATIAAYVWDYADGMAVIKRFWDAAASLDADAARLDEGVRFPLCRPAALQAAFAQAGLSRVETAPLELAARFASFDDYWGPFLGGQGPAPSYVASLTPERRAALRATLQSSLAIDADGTLTLGARAWAVRAAKAVDA